MLNGKYVKIGRVLEGLFRDYGFQGHDIDWIDAIEWLGEVLDLIGAPKQYISKTTDGNKEIGHPCPIVIANYRGTLPCDILYIVQCRENKSKIPMRYSGDTFHTGLQKSEANLPTLDLSYYGTIDFSSPLIAKGQLLKDDCDTELTYALSDCHIFTNFEEGEVEISYKAFPTDEDGFPMIPDNVRYVQASKAYLAEKIGQKMYLQGKLTQDKFNYIQRERDWYVGAATNEGLMPSLDEMESWKNQFVRLIPNMSAHDTSFKYIGDPAQMRISNSV